MSALRIVNARKGPMSTPCRCSVPGCHRSPKKYAEIMGWPVGRICTKHAIEWRAAWNEALTPAQVEDVAA
jgi:hypothetical protein